MSNYKKNQILKRGLGSAFQSKCIFAAKLFNKGWSREKVAEKLKEQYNVDDRAITRYINASYKILAEVNEEEIKNLRSIQFARLSNLLDIATEKKDVKGAVEVIKTMNQMFGLNQPEVQINIQNNECQFKFGEPYEDIQRIQTVPVSVEST